MGEKNRFIGTSAKNQIISNYKNSLWGWKQLIGRKFNDPVVQGERQHIAADVVESQNGSVGLRVRTFLIHDSSMGLMVTPFLIHSGSVGLMVTPFLIDYGSVGLKVTPFFIDYGSVELMVAPFLIDYGSV